MDGSRRADGTGWELLTSPEFREWHEGLRGPAAESVALALEGLVDSGAKPRSTLVKPIKSSRYREEMHELRSVGGSRRVLSRSPMGSLSAFNTRREAVLNGGL